jgi:hypothetical protein
MADRDGNLCPRAQVGMLRTATAMMALALLATVTLVELEVARVWRIAVVFLFLAAFLELIQGFTGTCVARAILGRRLTDQGTEEIANPIELVRIRARARRVVAASVLSAVGATGLVLLLS